MNIINKLQFFLYTTILLWNTFSLKAIVPIPSENPSKYQKQQIKRKYGMFIHFGINTFHDVE